jgi:hypothetical protein
LFGPSSFFDKFNKSRKCLVLIRIQGLLSMNVSFRIKKWKQGLANFDGFGSLQIQSLMELFDYFNKLVKVHIIHTSPDG